MKKIPWLAELLNILPFPMGLGYLYLGKRRSFIANLLVGAVLLIAPVILKFVSWEWGDISLWAFLVAAKLLLVAPPLALGTALHAYFLAGGTARMFLPQQGKLVLAVMMMGFPLALGAALFGLADDWRAPVGNGPNVLTSFPPKAFFIGAGFLAVLTGAVLVTWRNGGLGRLPVRWWRPGWAAAGLAVGIQLILLSRHSLYTAAAQQFVYLGAATLIVLVVGFSAGIRKDREFRQRWVWRSIGLAVAWSFSLTGYGLLIAFVGLPLLIFWTRDLRKTPGRWWGTAAIVLAALVGAFLGGGLVGARLAFALPGTGFDIDHGIVWLGLVQIFLIVVWAMVGSVAAANLAGMVFGNGPKSPVCGKPH